MNRTVCAFLNQSGDEATGCLQANEAYDAMYENVLEHIVTDRMMQEIDRFEFAKAGRSLSNEITSLVMTALDDSASKRRGYLRGIDYYLVKPIELDGLFQRIGALLRRAKSASRR